VPTDVLEDYVVMIEKRDGTVTTFQPMAFRLAARCPSTLLLSTCVERYNARMAREGIADRAFLVPRKRR
jgi:hypothetical protein